MNGPPIGHDELIRGIVQTVSDYRMGEAEPMTEDKVNGWVEQFDHSDRVHILRETHAVLNERYVTKENAVQFLDLVVTQLAGKFTGGDVQRFLAQTAFLNLQTAGKSQGAMLALLGDIIAPHGFAVTDCGGEAPKRYIYLDDVLCTGNRFYQDLRTWWLEQDVSGRARQDWLPADVRVTPVFIATHQRNWAKVWSRFRKTPELKPRAMPDGLWSALDVQNNVEVGSALDFCFPRGEGAPPAAEEYLRNLGVSLDTAFRPNGMPAKEVLFTSSAGRDTFERAVLSKGLEIIGSLSTHKPNMHPLGFTLPSQKSLGFGALVFTWRNVPNNSPLVFWHDAPNWAPLFKKYSNPFPDFSAFFG